MEDFPPLHGPMNKTRGLENISGSENEKDGIVIL
jgi:hypothetical protein